jgi:nitrogen fixation negative regulator NifL
MRLLQAGERTMSQSQAKSNYGEVIDAINRFLISPPEGTPSEVIEAFDLFGDGDYLPPKLFLETVEQAPVAISITDPQARILYVNGAFEGLTGYPRDKVIGANQSVLSSDSTPAEVYQELWQTISKREVWRGTLVNHRHGGDEYLAELTVSPVLAPNGEIAYFLGMHHDISDVHAMQQRLNFQKKINDVALDAAPMVVVMISGDGSLLLENQRYKELKKVWPQEPAKLFIQALERQLGGNMNDVCALDEGFTNQEVRIDQKGGSPRWFTCSGVRVSGFDDAASSYFQSPDARRCSLLLTANEITASRERINQARLNMIRATMAEQQMVQTMREALSASVFKMQAPINIIKAAMSMSGNGGDSANMTAVLRQALESGEEAMASLRNVLPEANAEESANINVNELLHEVLRLSTDPLLAAGVVVDWRAAPVLPKLVGRPNALRAMFKYLVDNAIQALNESDNDFRELRLETRAEGGEIEIAIMDNGPGIAEADLFKVFEPFYCGWQQPRGHAGMGLTLAQEAINDHGGGIEIDRNFLGGCRIFICLPCDSGEEMG